jgi:hypothetical protein
MSPNAARAAPLISALGRTQYGVRPGSPDDQTRLLLRAIDDAARRFRWRCRRASIAPRCFACKAARN